jgi:acyl carrier protein
MADVSQISTWLVNYIAEKCKIAPSQVARTTPFNVLGMDSLMAVAITVEMEEQFGIALPPTALLEFNTVGLLMEFIGKSQDLRTG